ncbi:plasmid mobilization relaxosome protein MobC [Pedobacter sp. ASV28]|uniref:plasmid mobilization relaxosome protein MobC n=1 Tax=Pedobacter sp. ASV28 TaxID=2795123 RepID=UPI0018ED7691|nr:plasmid mobilization relaxosome protein MobC [Pedobacter sp. ASV28]
MAFGDIPNRKTRRFELRLSDQELKEFLALEKSLGISRADIVRIRVLKNSAKMLVNAKDLLKHLDLIGTELGRSGNNINQLAKHANTLQKHGQLAPGIATDFNALFSEYIRLQNELEKLIRQLLRQMKG